MQESDDQEIDRESEIYQKFMMSKESTEQDPSFNISDIDDVIFRYFCDVDITWSSLDKNKRIKFDDQSDLKEFLDLDIYEQAKEVRGRYTSHDWKASNIETGIKIGLIITIESLGNSEKEVFIEQEIKNLSDFKRISQLLSKTDDSDDINIDCGESSVDLTYIEDDESYIIKTEDYRFKGRNPDERWMNIARDRNIIPDEIYEYLKNGEKYACMYVSKPSYNSEKDTISIEANKNFTVELTFEDPESNKKLRRISNKLGRGDLILIEDSEIYLSHAFLDLGSNSIISEGGWNLYQQKPKIYKYGISEFLQKFKFW